METKKTEQMAPLSVCDRMLEVAIEKEDLGRLENLMAFEAQKAFHVAMSAFQKNPPKIEKDQVVGYKSKAGGLVGYSHASLANVATQINTALSRHDMFAMWKTSQVDNGIITVTCTISHSMGHSVSTSLSHASDTSGKKNSIQAIGSTITYLERYTILALTGLATHDMDDDGATSGASPKDFLSPEQQKEITSLVDKVYAPQQYIFFDYMGVYASAEILKDDYAKAKSVLARASEHRKEVK